MLETWREIADLRRAGPLHALTLLVRVRLTKELADRLNGYHLRAYQAGEVVDLPDGVATMLLDDNWAEPVNYEYEARDTCDDRPPPRPAPPIES